MNADFIRPYCLFLISLILVTISDYSFCQVPQDTRFATINNATGLPNNMVTAMVNDSLGFVWIGTGDGLCRYESQDNFKIYRKNDPQIEGGIENSSIRSLFSDSKNNLWIGTRLGGLTRYHQASETWKTFKNQKDNPNSIINDEILAIAEDKKGRIWVGTEEGISIYHPATETFTSFTAKDKKSIKGKAVLSIQVDEQGLIWLGTWGGGLELIILPEDGDLSKAIFRQFDVSEEGGAKNIWKVYQDRKNRYWIGSRGAGLYLMDLPENLTIPPSSEDWQPKFHVYNFKNSNISTDHIEDIYQDVRGNFWVGTVNGLDCIWSKELSAAFKNRKPNEGATLKFQNFKSHPQKVNSLVSNNINTIFEDNQGTLWFGTYSGISQYNWYTNQFDVYNIVDDIAKTPNTQNLYIDKKGIAWFGYGDEGIIKYNLSNNKKTLFTLNDQSLKGKYVFSLYSPDHKNLYIGTIEGIISLDMTTNQSKMYPVPEYVNNGKGFLYIRSLFSDKQNRIWIGTLTGLYIIDEENGIYKKYSHDPTDPFSISDNSINQVYQDSNNDIWISSFNGLNKVVDIHSKTLKFESFKHDPENEGASLPSNRIISLSEVDKTLFVGTNTGLVKYDLKKKTFSNFGEKENKKNIQTIEETIDGNLWASTTEGILFLNTKTNQFNHYDKNDGLGDIIFLSGSSYHDHKGYIYFGSRQGITRFHPANLTNNEMPPPVYVTEVKKMSPNNETRSSGVYAKEIILEHNEYYLGLDYAALNYNRPEKNKYAFKLEGLEDNWNYPETKSTAVYTNLAPGTYTFRVKAANNDGVWNEKGASVKIIKLAAFWQTWWFKCLGIILTLCLLFWGMKFYTRNIKERNKILQKFNNDLNHEITNRKKIEAVLQEREQHMEHLVKVRTQELEIKNQEVKKLLTEISERNEQLEVEIANRTQNLRLSNEELIRSNKDLEQFAYIASHDLQEPLRVVGTFIGLLRRRYKEHFDEEAFQYMDFAIDGVQRMSEQIKNVLTFSKVSQQAIDFQLTDVNQVIETKLHDLSQSVKERNVSFKIENMPEIFCEKTQLEMVFFNLISNAIKFNKNKVPLITISNHTTAEDGFWHFSVKDNGIGIDDKDKEKVFEIFRQLHNKKDYEGTGIGLALCQKIIHRHDGKIWVESIKDIGTTFHFTISKKLANRTSLNPTPIKKEISQADQ